MYLNINSEKRDLIKLTKRLLISLPIKIAFTQIIIIIIEMKVLRDSIKTARKSKISENHWNKLKALNPFWNKRRIKEINRISECIDRITKG